MQILEMFVYLHSRCAEAFGRPSFGGAVFAGPGRADPKKIGWVCVVIVIGRTGWNELV